MKEVVKYGVKGRANGVKEIVKYGVKNHVNKRVKKRVARGRVRISVCEVRA